MLAHLDTRSTPHPHFSCTLASIGRLVLFVHNLLIGLSLILYPIIAPKSAWLAHWSATVFMHIHTGSAKIPSATLGRLALNLGTCHATQLGSLAVDASNNQLEQCCSSGSLAATVSS